MRRIFLDMDGVLTKWEHSSIEQVASRGYFIHRQPQKNVIDAVTILSKNKDINLYILSSVFMDDHSINEKVEWNRIHVPVIPIERQIFVPYGMSKEAGLDMIGGIKKDDVLLDDFSENLHKWGGVGIKLYNGINGTKGTWTGYSVHASMKPEFLARQIAAIAMYSDLKEEMV